MPPTPSIRVQWCCISNRLTFLPSAPSPRYSSPDMAANSGGSGPRSSSSQSPLDDISCILHALSWTGCWFWGLRRAADSSSSVGLGSYWGSQLISWPPSSQGQSDRHKHALNRSHGHWAGEYQEKKAKQPQLTLIYRFTKLSTDGLLPAVSQWTGLTNASPAGAPLLAGLACFSRQRRLHSGRLPFLPSPAPGFMQALHNFFVDGVGSARWANP